jgi:hypothetical protein
MLIIMMLIFHIINPLLNIQMEKGSNLIGIMKEEVEI